jgi:hypothetical protein
VDKFSKKTSCLIRDEEECHSGGIAMSVWTPIMMKMDFVVVPSGAGPEGTTTKAIFEAIFFSIQRSRLL